MRVECKDCNCKLFSIEVAPKDSTEHRSFILCSNCGHVLAAFERNEVQALEKIRLEMEKKNETERKRLQALEKAAWRKK